MVVGLLWWTINDRHVTQEVWTDTEHGRSDDGATDRQTGANEPYGSCIHEHYTASERYDYLSDEHEKYCLLVRDAV